MIIKRIRNIWLTIHMWIKRLFFRQNNSSVVAEIISNLNHDTSPTTIVDRNERKRLYEALRDHILKAQLSNSENYDKAILSLASAFLGGTLTFIDKIVRLSSAWFKPLLFIGWSALILAIISTLLSFLISQKAYDVLLFNAEQYYIHLKNEYLDPAKNKWSGIVKILNYTSVVLFIIGITLIAFFIAYNLFYKEGYNG